MNNCYRALISLSTILPVCISFSYVYADWVVDIFPLGLRKWMEAYFSVKLFCVVVAIAVNVGVGVFIRDCLRWFSKKSCPISVKIKTTRELGGDALLIYLPYVLPFFMTQSEGQEPLGWLLGILFLLCLSWASMTISFSPLLRVLGVKFFEVGLEDGKVVTLLIGDKLRPLHVSRVVVISDSCFYGVK